MRLVLSAVPPLPLGAAARDCRARDRPAQQGGGGGGADAGAMADAARAGAAGEAPGTAGDAEEAARRSRGVMTYGCEHYRRRCALVAPCCGKVFTCRHCHNEVQFEQEPDVNLKHELVRKDVKEVVCLLCDTRQPVGPTCTSCGVDFGAYYCEKNTK